MATKLIKAGGTAVLVGNINGKEVAMSVAEVQTYMDAYFASASDDSLAGRAKELLYDFLTTTLREVQAETF